MALQPGRSRGGWLILKKGQIMTRNKRRTLALAGCACLALLGPVSPAGATASGDRWAVVNAVGTLARDKGASKVVNYSAGNYQVVFDKNVRACGFHATLGNAGTAIPPNGQVSVSPVQGSVRSLFVVTQNSAGVPTNLSFHLYVGC